MVSQMTPQVKQMTKAFVLEKLGVSKELLKGKEFNRELSEKEFWEYVIIVYFGALSIIKKSGGQSIMTLKELINELTSLIGEDGYSLDESVYIDTVDKNGEKCFTEVSGVGLAKDDNINGTGIFIY